jgi:sucrose-6-phosphate hydrolase SacC (GH32 family)
MTTSRELQVQHKYLNLPVENGAAMRRMRFVVDGETVRSFDIELATDKVDFWVFSDVMPFRGQRLTVEVDALDAGEPALETIVHSDTIKGGEDLYQELYRPQFHFTSRRGWHNDPNGLVYYKGTYHLFYQHNPYGWAWGNMHWGHAVSEDMVHWRELGDKLYPDVLGTMFSGSGVVDWTNSAGLSRGNEDAIIFLYTAAGDHADPPVPFTQCIAYSTDRGQTLEKYTGSPVLGHIADHNRDPKVIWHAESQGWVMALYLDKVGDEQRFALYRSADLKAWTHLHDVTLPGSGECPDFFPLALDGQERWVFWAADGHYLVGSFDGQRFVPQTGPLRAYCGGAQERVSAYAAQTWSDVQDGRRIQIAWLRGSIPGMPFNQQMSFPVELTLCSTAQGPHLRFAPIGEIESLYRDQRTLSDVEVTHHAVRLPGEGHDLLDVQTEIDLQDASTHPWL